MNGWLIIVTLVWAFVSIVLFGGCATSRQAEVKAIQVSALATVEAIASETPEPTREDYMGRAKTEIYQVMKGDCLWTIAGQVYDDPFQWPVIFQDNRDKIYNADRIEVGQELEIERGFDDVKVGWARLYASNWPPYRKPGKSSKWRNPGAKNKRLNRGF